LAQKLKLLFVTRSINQVLGGLEKQIVTIADGLSQRGHEVYVVSLDTGDVKPFFRSNLTQGITWIGLGIGNPEIKANLGEKIRRQYELYRLIRRVKPDVAVAFMIGAFLVSRLPTFFTRVPLILAERNSPDIYRLTSARKKRFLYFIIMFFSKRITIQFEEYKNKYPRFLRKKFVAIPNSIELYPVRRDSIITSPRFVYAGRFSFQKRIDLLICSFKKYCELGGLGTLHLFGSGEQDHSLKELVKSLKAERIFFHPPTREITEVLKVCDINCLLSIWEGFPNFVAEGLAAGIPVIGLKECDGVSHLVENGKTGWLSTSTDVEEIARIMRAIDDLSTDAMQSFQVQAKLSMSKFDSATIFHKWDQLFFQLA
jgi:glycosyltransferase involved in cell wall biosynthesis